MPSFAGRAGTYHFDDVGQGRPVVFGHGLSCDRAMFEAQVRAMEGRYRCVSLDWPGHGSRTTFNPAGWTLDDLAADAAALIEHLGAGPAVLVGLSQGGMVFMRVAIGHPELVRGLVLLDTSARAEPAERIAAIRSNLERLRHAPGEEWASFIRDGAIPAFFGQPWRDGHPEDVEREVALRLGHDRTGYELAVRAVIDREALPLARLAGIDVPVAVVVGELDQLTPVDQATELAGAIPGAELTIVEDAGHHTPIERPDAVTDAIASLLDRIAARPDRW